MDLSGKVAVVTGASSGLGKAFSMALHHEGMTVFGLARRKDRLDEMAKVLGERFVAVECDVTDDESLQKAFAHVGKTMGRLDVLVNNAGLGQFGDFEALTPEQLDVQLDTNVRGLIRASQLAVPTMAAQAQKNGGLGGHIVNIASVAGLVGNPQISVYNATKFAVRGVSEAMMKELRPQGIKVTCFYPGSVETEFADVAGSKGNPDAMHAEDLADTLVHVLKAPRRYLISEVVMRPMTVKG
ncbi:MAG: SDR family NAD(P)-dependent oxidoreductase [Bacteroidetes bacterium]|nr:SDR family NAD(P)-dependent oxidoreductase [Bacteroidota bacterium]